MLMAQGTPWLNKADSMKLSELSHLFMWGDSLHALTLPARLVFLDEIMYLFDRAFFPGAVPAVSIITKKSIPLFTRQYNFRLHTQLIL